MFCPECHDEFRPGFTRCAACDVELVAELPSRVSAGLRAIARPVTASAPLRDLCGFLELDEARAARERLRPEGIRSEIVIRDGPDPATEEYWLRVEVPQLAAAAALVDFDAADAGDEDASFLCGHCGHKVNESAERCPKCGAGFDAD